LSTYPTIENLETDKYNITVVVARYNEGLEWLKDDIFKHLTIICYNSGENEDFYKPENMKIVKIDNIGKEAYTYIYHIINNYDNLSEVTIFLPGSCDHHYRLWQVNSIIDNVKEYNTSVFFSSFYNNVQKELYNFTMDYYCSTNLENSALNDKCILNKSDIRPFGKWYEKMFGNIKITHVNYRGILAVHKKHITQKPDTFYKTLLSEFKKPNDEVAHYFERSWEAIFYPMEGANFLIDSNPH
jgi:hypothetical protein